jgi:hypothetical protein
MNEDLLKVIGLVVVTAFIIFMVVKSLKLQKSVLEGLTNSSSSTSMSGIAGSATNYAAAIQAQSVQIQDALLISKYRSDYEAIIINMDTYLNLLIMQGFLNLNTNSSSAATNLDAINSINSLYSAKQALNGSMKFIDGIV